MVCLPPGSRVPYLGNPSHSSKHPVRQGLSSSLYRAGNGHTEMLRDLPEVTQLVNSRAGI